MRSLPRVRKDETRGCSCALRTRGYQWRSGSGDWWGGWGEGRGNGGRAGEGGLVADGGEITGSVIAPDHDVGSREGETKERTGRDGLGKVPRERLLLPGRLLLLRRRAGLGADQPPAVPLHRRLPDRLLRVERVLARLLAVRNGVGGAHGRRPLERRVGDGGLAGQRGELSGGGGVAEREHREVGGERGEGGGGGGRGALRGGGVQHVCLGEAGCRRRPGCPGVHGQTAKMLAELVPPCLACCGAGVLVAQGARTTRQGCAVRRGGFLRPAPPPRGMFRTACPPACFSGGATGGACGVPRERLGPPTRLRRRPLSWPSGHRGGARRAAEDAATPPPGRR
ncbi:hypothetical protein DFJ74DRAFT_490420 [Hyaloraphidium curvatum]|nr:hypothetical protein DFJ74DRAFT_490420 [Hyaloraphidium curvatum]